ncbi:MAG: RDD family protein [Acidimicrobiales bacterium]|jgi:uncharacterized RDD family membrane protein YckC|nr:RDD family protein [Acidimicrobiales bacterium]
MDAYPPGAPADPTDVAWRRVGAAAVDVGIGAVIALVLFVALSEDTFGFDARSGSVVVEQELRGAGLVLFYGAVAAYDLGVFVLQRGLTGRTLGTMALGLATVGADGQPLGAPRALLRSAAGIVDYLPCCVPAVGVATMFTTTGHRRVGDMAASSFVVDARWAGSPVPGDGPPPARPWTPPWTPPTAAPSAAAPVAPPTAPPTAPVPQWDAGRQAYVAWDPQRRQWLQFDQRAQRWTEYDPVMGGWRPVGGGPTP